MNIKNMVINLQLTDNECASLLNSITIASDVLQESIGNSSNPDEIREITKIIETTTTIINKISVAYMIQTSILTEEINN